MPRHILDLGPAGFAERLVYQVAAIVEACRRLGHKALDVLNHLARNVPFFG